MPDVKIKTENILFLDIETVPEHASFAYMADDMQALWNKKAHQVHRGEEVDGADVYQEAGIYAEFGKIVCISVGCVRVVNDRKTFISKSFADDDEKVLLQGFIDLVNKSYSMPDRYFCGHNAKEFDMPYIARRIIINGLPLPEVLNVAGKKPWEVNYLDTLEMWKFGDYKAFTSLNLLTHVLGIPTPKDDIDGSQVASVYYDEHDLKRISVYCEKDVLATAQVYMRIKGESLIDQEHDVIHHA